MRRLFTCAAAVVMMSAVLTAPAAHAAPRTVTYRVWAENGPLIVATIGYNEANGARQGAMNPQLPWGKDITWTDDTKHPVINVTGYNNGDGARIYCQILVDGQVVDEDDRVELATCSYATDGLPREHCMRGNSGSIVGIFTKVDGDPCSSPR
ncbi:MmpS family transport accessory protein [Mycobacterium sp. NPDC050853]|uniref:MmpS family transport accessory protein n=1 Tax=Mycobacteriaceae TaxID=1762 RepID=UPI0015DFE28C|nr:hypothetical protein [Mycobacteroides sp. LB1]